MQEALVKLLTDVTQMKTLPDADVEWIINTLETPILMKIREPLEKMYASGASNVPPTGVGPPGGMGQPPGGDMDMMAMMGGGGGPSPSMGQTPPPAVPGLRSEPDMSGAVDELRRVMGGLNQ
jgi:hypothetical protein